MNSCSSVSVFSTVILFYNAYIIIIIINNIFSPSQFPYGNVRMHHTFCRCVSGGGREETNPLSSLGGGTFEIMQIVKAEHAPYPLFFSISPII